MINVCVCGGGNLAHAFVGFLSKNSKISRLTVLTRRPDEWSKQLIVYHNGIFKHTVKGFFVTDDFNVLLDADVVILTLPCNIRYSYLTKIKRYLSSQSLILTAPSIGGINFILDKYFSNNRYACFQRVPYICRIKEYGNSVNVDVKKNVEIYYSQNCSSEDKETVSNVLKIPIVELLSFWPLLLSNSNPIIHIARLCEILQTDYPCAKIPLFYEEWGNLASELALAMDNELALIMKRLNVNEYRSLLKHYEVANVLELTNKIRSIPSFHNILAPMRLEGKVFVLDEQSRYLTEDLAYGTCFIKYIASLLKISTPVLDSVIHVIQRILNQCFVNSEGCLNHFNWEKYIGFSVHDIVFSNHIKELLEKDK